MADLAMNDATNAVAATDATDATDGADVPADTTSPDNDVLSFPSNPALERLESSIAKLRELIKGAKAADFKSRRREVMVETLLTKLAHDDIVQQVDVNRESLRDAQRELNDAKLQLANIRYEKTLLQGEVAACKAQTYGNLDKVNADLPHLFQNDKNAPHQKVMQALNGELNTRKRLRKGVNNARTELKQKKMRMNNSRTVLSELPGAVKKVVDCTANLRKMLGIKGEVGVKMSQMVHQLPTPLYILARSVTGYAEAVGGVSIEVEDVGKEERKEGDLYVVDAKCVALHVNGEGDKDGMTVRFRYHSRLHMVSVTCDMVEWEAESKNADMLAMLYPFDYGESAPNANSGHVEGGDVRFDARQLGNARAYLWANVACGITVQPCMEGMEGEEGKDVGNWARKAGNAMRDVCVRDVLEALKRRVGDINKLRKEVETLTNRKEAAKKNDGGKMRVEFREVIDASRAQRESVGRPGTNGRFTSVFEMSVECGDVKAEAVFGVEKDYPTGRPVVKVCERGGMKEGDTLRLEQAVNRIEYGEEKEGLLTRMVERIEGDMSMLGEEKEEEEGGGK